MSMSSTMYVAGEDCREAGAQYELRFPGKTIPESCFPFAFLSSSSFLFLFFFDNLRTCLILIFFKAVSFSPT